MGGTVLFCWYWTTGYATERVEHTFLKLMVFMPFYDTTVVQTFAAMAPLVQISALSYTSSFLYMLILWVFPSPFYLFRLLMGVGNSNGVLQPFTGSSDGGGGRITSPLTYTSWKH
jgi:hypothetical protein